MYSFSFPQLKGTPWVNFSLEKHREGFLFVKKPGPNCLIVGFRSVNHVRCDHFQRVLQSLMEGTRLQLDKYYLTVGSVDQVRQAPDLHLHNLPQLEAVHVQNCIVGDFLSLCGH